MITLIDSFLNKITMYKLVFYVLVILIAIAIAFSFFGLLPYSPLALLFSALFITLISYITNILFAWAFNAPTNTESIYITAFILILIITPPSSPGDMAYFALALWASVWAMASKYVFAIGKKHIFNPAAIAVVITALTLNLSATWWVGTLYMLPFVLIGGLLITRKIKRFDLVISFFTTACIAIILSHSLVNGSIDASRLTLSAIWVTLTQVLVYTPLLFFAFVMLTEPLTTPPTRNRRISYAALTGFFFAPAIHIGSVFSTPELALVVSNIFSYLASPKQKLLLTLKDRTLIAKYTANFSFVNNPGRQFSFKPGQYLEWTLPHEKVDSRGNRRYFTIASSPTERDIMIGVKFYANASSFKNTLVDMKQGDVIVASQLAGDFTLPKDTSEKLVFIAGGIGITPFRSMIKYLIDTNEQRDIVLIYSNKTVEDIAYKDIFDEAEVKLGIKVIYTLTDKHIVPFDWKGKVGYVDAAMLETEVPDFKERTYYISGPNSMVVAFSDTLSTVGVPRSHIKKDYFPGFA